MSKRQDDYYAAAAWVADRLRENANQLEKLARLRAPEVILYRQADLMRRRLDDLTRLQLWPEDVATYRRLGLPAPPELYRVRVETRSGAMSSGDRLFRADTPEEALWLALCEYPFHQSGTGAGPDPERWTGKIAGTVTGLEPDNSGELMNSQCWDVAALAIKNPCPYDEA